VLGTVKVWAIELSPDVGELPPTIAEYVPLRALVEMDVEPAAVHPPRVPVSNPPFTMLAAAVTASETVVAWVALVPVPDTVSVYVPAAAVPALTVSVLEPPLVTLVGLSDALAPLGVPLTVRFTV
jgi:hypothetical protein